MKRERDEADALPCDPVLAQLDFLINGPPKEARGPPPPDPVLAHLDALINGGGGASAPAAAPMATTSGAPPFLPPLLSPAPPVEAEPRGPPGILREFGGIRGWLRARGYAASPTRSTPPPDCDATNRPSSDQAA
jgi:hypothetical protein